MNEASISVETDEEEYVSLCSCCGLPIHNGYSWLISRGKAIAAFWYRWPEGHAGSFSLAIARFDECEIPVPGVVRLEASMSDGAMRFEVVDPDASHWDFEWAFGPASSRADALIDKRRVYALVDEIVAKETRLASRILATIQSH